MTTPVFPAYLRLEAKGADDAKAQFIKSVNDLTATSTDRLSKFSTDAQVEMVKAFTMPSAAKTALTSEVDRVTMQALGKLETFSASARRNLDAALSGRTTASGGIDVDVAGARQAAAVAEQRASVARQLAEATKVAALAERDFSQATRLSIAATKQLAQEETEAAATARAQADATARLQAAMDRAGISAKGLAGANDNLTRATGAQRQGLQQLGYQLSDIATMYSLGAKPAQIFASQLGQTVQAVQLMAGGTSRLATFLAGPWGIALSTATIAAAPFIGKLWETYSAANAATGALQSLIEKQRQQAREKRVLIDGEKDLNALIKERDELQKNLGRGFLGFGTGGALDVLGRFTDDRNRSKLADLNRQIAEGRQALDNERASAVSLDRIMGDLAEKRLKDAFAVERQAKAKVAKVKVDNDEADAMERFLYAGMKAAQAFSEETGKALGAGLDKDTAKYWQGVADRQAEALESLTSTAQANADWNTELMETVRLLEQIGGAGSALGDIGRILGSLSGGNLGALPGAAGIIGKALGGVTWQTVDGDGNRMVRQLGDEFASVLDNVFGSRGSFSKVLESAGIGSAAGQAFLGSKGNNAGSAIGGILGEVAGKALGKGIGGALGSAMGPIGSVLGGVVGGALGSAFKKTTSGFAVISNRGVTSGGNNRELAQGAQNTGDSISAQLQSIAERLGGSVGDYAVSIGTRSSGWIRVSASGSSDVAGKNFYKSPDAIYNGKDPAEAARIALLNALQDGAIQGIRDGAKRLLQTGKDVERALNRALSFEQVFKDLKAFKDPNGAALDTLNLEFRRLIDIFKEASASTAEMAQLEELYGIRRADAVRDANERILGSLKGLKEYLTVGSEFYSLRDRQAQAQAIYNPLADRVRAGDATAFDAFAKASQDLLEIERQINGSTGAFYARADEIRALTDQAIAGKQAVSDAAAVSDSPFTALASQQQATTSAIDAQTAALLAALGGINDNLVASLRARIDATGQSNTVQYTGLFAPRGSW